ncbi:MAG TPA: hypothetical protein VKD24_01500 [Candidatus Angelobacter sp.]|nr:hypothetical protein [Candidatus Angelobacter sp.]
MPHQALARHAGFIYFCYYKAGADFDQIAAKYHDEVIERRRLREEAQEYRNALNRFKDDAAGFMAWIEARARADLNREHKLDALHRLAADPRTPAGEAQAARAAIQRLKKAEELKTNREPASAPPGRPVA